MVEIIEAKGGQEAILSRIEAGELINDIAADLSQAMIEQGFDGIDRRTLGAWLNRTPESQQALARAREASAHALADEALGEARATKEGNHKSKSVKIKALQWQAGKLNRAVYGDTPMIAMQFNVGDLSLEALKQSPPPVPQHLVVGPDLDVDNQGE